MLVNELSQAVWLASNLRPASAKERRRQRERMVSSIRCGSVVSRIKSDLGGGSSSVFKNALAACTFSRSAATMTPTFKVATVGFRLTVCINSRISAMVITLDLDSGRIHETSGWLY